MRLRTLIPALGLIAVTLVAPAVAEASHRHSRSCGHHHDGYGRGCSHDGGYGHSYSYGAPSYNGYYQPGRHYYCAPPPGACYRPYYRPYARPYCSPRRPYLSFGFRF